MNWQTCRDWWTSTAVSLTMRIFEWASHFTLTGHYVSTSWSSVFHCFIRVSFDTDKLHSQHQVRTLFISFLKHDYAAVAAMHSKLFIMENCVSSVWLVKEHLQSILRTIICLWVFLCRFQSIQSSEQLDIGL